MPAEPRATGRLPRRSRAVLAALLAAVAITVAGGPGAASAAAKPSPEFFGVVPAGPTTPQDFANMAANGVRTLRVMLFWPSIQPFSAVDYEWGGYDYFVGQAAKYGIRVFPTIYGTPNWAHFLAGDDGCGSSCGPAGDQSRQAFASFARAAAERYGPGGTFWEPSVCGVLCEEPAPCGCTTPQPVHSWQLWNEQNSPKYYGPAPNVEEYAHLLFETAGAIRAVDPSAEIVLGGMWGPPKTAAVMPAAEYLKRLYRVPGIATAFDAIAVHPYSPNLSGVIDQIVRVRRVVRQAGDANVGTWVTELGWASGGPRNQGLVKTPKGQARLLERSFEALIEKRRTWRIRGITWYAWRDATAAETDCRWCPRAGLRSRTGSAKPAARAFRRMALGKN